MLEQREVSSDMDESADEELLKQVGKGSPPRNCLQVQRGIARKGGGGGLNACQDGLGHLSAPNQMGNLLD